MPPLTSRQKQQRRRARLNEIARQLGYPTGYKLMTAIINDEIHMERKMSNDTIYSQTMTLSRDDFRTEAEYRKAYQDCNRHYGYKARVEGGWMFFEFGTDYQTWKKQK